MSDFSTEQAKQGEKVRHEELSSTIQMIGHIEAEVGPAVLRTKKATADLSNRERLDNIKANTRDELARLNPIRAWRLGNFGDDAHEPVNDTNSTSTQNGSSPDPSSGDALDSLTSHVSSDARASTQNTNGIVPPMRWFDTVDYVPPDQDMDDLLKRNWRNE
jgi:hypothetical protein